MRFTCTRGELQRGLQTAVRTVPARTSLPILSNVLIQAESDGLTLTCYDQEVGMKVTLPARVETPGEVTAPAKLMAEVVGDLPEADVAVSDDARHTVTLTCQKSQFNLAGLPADDFPPLPEVGDETRMLLPVPLFREIVKQTIFAVASEDSRPPLKGVFFGIADGALTAVSTDTHRLCIRQASPPEVTGAAQVILPDRALDQLMRAVPADTQESIELRLSRNQALFHCRDVTIISRLIEGPFPQYERVLPAAYEKLLTVEREPFLRATRRVAIVARGEKTNRLVLRTKEDCLQLSAESSGLGKAFEEVAVAREGEEVELAFNCDYLLDVLNVLEQSEIRLEISGQLTPCVIRAQEDTSFRYILMPMQIA